jgi:ubiquitin-activating enzyme E1
MHEDKRHIYQEGDHVVFREVEGMVEINNTKPIKIIATDPKTITLELDSSKFGDYTRQGIVENVKVPKPVEFHSWEQSFKNPVASSQYGMLETPDLSKFGRSDQLHAALIGIVKFVKAHSRYPENTKEDIAEALKLSKEAIAAG